MSLIDLYISDGGSIRRIGDNQHDMLTIEDGELCYYNLQNGDGCRLGEDGEWYKFVDNVDEYGYNCDPRKTENSSEIPNNCKTCKWGEWYRQGYDITMMDDECGGCCSWNSKWTPKDEPQIIACPINERAEYWFYEDEPQTEVDTARAIVHKIIDNSEIAEDAYPDLRQRLHDAVDEYEPQTERGNE